MWKLYKEQEVKIALETFIKGMSFRIISQYAEKGGNMRKDKNGWYLFSKTPATKTFINDDLPNILCRRYYVAGVLYPWEVMSGKLSDDKKSFSFDGKIQKTGFAATKYYKNNSAIKKLMIKKEA